jgi:hypothetical protein
MPKNTPNINLITYNIITDGSSLSATYTGDTTGSLPGATLHIEEEYAFSSSGSIRRLSASATALTASALVLNNQVFGTTVLSGSYNQFKTDEFGKIISASIVTNVAGYSVMTNKSGYNLEKGTVCIYSPNTANSFSISEAYGNADICGVLLDNCDANMEGALAKVGTVPVKISGCVVMGNWLIVTGGSTGAAMDFMSGSYVSGSTKPLYGGVGVALENVTSGSLFSGIIMADINITPMRSGFGLKPLSPSSFYNPTGYTATDLHYCDYGTDIIILRSGNQNGNDFGRYANKGMRKIASISDSSAHFAQIWMMQYPDFGTNDISTIRAGTDPARLLVTNLTGNILTSSGCPIKNIDTYSTGAGTASSFIRIVPSSPGDILLDVMVAESAGTDWIPTEPEQVVEYSITGVDPRAYWSWRYASSGSETRMGWQGTTVRLSYSLAVVAGGYTDKGAY